MTESNNTPALQPHVVAAVTNDEIEARAIPDDIRVKADVCYRECEQMDSYGIIETIAKAILAERERCNLIIDTFARDVLDRSIKRSLASKEVEG